MTPADPSALLAHLDALRAAATAGPWFADDEQVHTVLTPPNGSSDEAFMEWSDRDVDVCTTAGYQEDEVANAAFIVALVNNYPALAAAIRDGEARVAELALQRVVNQEQWKHLALLMAECDAATARADAAEKVCRSLLDDDVHFFDESTWDLLEAWQAVAMRSGEGTT